MVEITPELEAAILEVVSRATASSRKQLTDATQRLESVEGQLGRLLSDPSLNRSLGSPIWMSGVSILDGTVTADKLTVNELSAVTTNTGTLNVTGTITAAASYPAVGARVQIDDTGLRGFRNAANTTFKLNTDGSGEIGGTANKITWDTNGNISIPAVLVQNLTISQVSNGVIGGQYTTSNVYPRIEFDVYGIRAKINSSTTTFSLEAGTGNLTITGTFALKSASSGQRIEIASYGITGYDAYGNQGFIINANGTGRLGPANAQSITYGPNGIYLGNQPIDPNGKLNQNHISVPNLSALNADLGSINAGQMQSVTLNSTTINSSQIYSTQFIMQAGGSIQDNDGSFWDKNGIVLKGAGDSILFQTASGQTAGGIGYDSTGFYVSSYNARSMICYFSSLNPSAEPETRGVWVSRADTLMAGFCIHGHLHLGGNGAATGFSVLGSVIGRMAVYNMAGSQIGWVPIYNTINP